MSDVKYKVIVGLEIHVQLATRTKMFCGCALSFGEEPNSRVCPVCMGMPGSLPVMNKKAVEYSILAGLALNCRIAPYTKWDRKSYYYPDLPKNYQISQYDLPFCFEGRVQTSFGPVGITRVHLEEDTGKLIHQKVNLDSASVHCQRFRSKLPPEKPRLFSRDFSGQVRTKFPFAKAH